MCPICLVQERWPSCHLFGKEQLNRLISLFVGMPLSIFPFDVWDKLWVLIRSVPEESLLIYFTLKLKIISQIDEYLVSLSSKTYVFEDKMTKF